MRGSQLDLFAQQRSTADKPAPDIMREPPPPDFVMRIREELEATLRSVRQAASFPWPNLTQTTLAELRFHSIAGWLPDAEATSLRAAFETEMARLYAAEDDRRQAAESE